MPQLSHKNQSIVFSAEEHQTIEFTQENNLSGTASDVNTFPSYAAANRYGLIDYKEKRARAVGNTLDEIRIAIQPSESELTLRRRLEQVFQDNRRIKHINALTNFCIRLTESLIKLNELAGKIMKFFHGTPQP